MFRKPHQNIFSAAFSAISRFSLFFTHPEMQEKFWGKIQPEFLFNCWLSEKFSGSKSAFENNCWSHRRLSESPSKLPDEGSLSIFRTNYVKVFIDASKHFKFNFLTSRQKLNLQTVVAHTVQKILILFEKI